MFKTLIVSSKHCFKIVNGKPGESRHWSTSRNLGENLPEFLLGRSNFWCITDTHGWTHKLPNGQMQIGVELECIVVFCILASLAALPILPFFGKCPKIRNSLIRCRCCRLNIPQCIVFFLEHCSSANCRHRGVVKKGKVPPMLVGKCKTYLNIKCNYTLESKTKLRCSWRKITTTTMMIAIKSNW